MRSYSLKLSSFILSILIVFPLASLAEEAKADSTQTQTQSQPQSSAQTQAENKSPSTSSQVSGQDVKAESQSQTAPATDPKNVSGGKTDNQPAVNQNETVSAQNGSQAQPAAEQKTDSDKSNLKVVRIDVKGNRVISTQTILNKIKTHEGIEITQQDINEDIKRLYATGFFQDIRMDMEDVEGGIRLIVVVDEKPVVRHVTIEGNKVFKERDLLKDLGVIEGQTLDEFSVKEGVNKIRERYANKGFRFVTVEYQLDTDPTTREASVSITINEGQKFLVSQVKFEGAHSISQKKLRKLMRIRSRNIFFFRFGIFREEQLRDDLDRVTAYYQQQGFLDVKVGHDVQFDEKTKKITIIVQVEEGKRYSTGKVEIKGVGKLPESEIWQRLKMLPTFVYSQYNLQEDAKAIRDFYQENGYMDVRVVPDADLNQETGKVDVVYQIEEGDLYFVDKVKIRGNTKTRDVVIRRELKIRPGDRFDGQAIERSKQKLQDLNFFDEVTYDTEQSSATNRKDIVFRVKEKRTGELSFGAGVSSIDQFLGFAEISQRNFDLMNWPRFTGGGQNISLRGRWGTITRNFEFSFVEPYIFNRPISLGLDAYDTRNEKRNVDFIEDRLGLGLTFSKVFWEFMRAGLGYRFERVKLSDLETDAPLDVRLFEGSNWLSRLKLFLTRDTRDSIIFPTKGYVAGISGELVGTFLGGDQNYYNIQANGTKYWSFSEGRHVIEWRNRIGATDELTSSEMVPVFDRFFAGGYGTVRGYNYRRVGPIEHGSAVGGNTMLISNLEYTFPIPYLENFKGAAFVDVGNIEKRSYRIYFDEFRVSVGPGLKVNTPIGPLAFYYGLPIVNRDTKNRNGRFEFSISRSF